MARTKVAHIITKLELGGAQLNTLFTLAQLNRNEYEPILISGSGGMLVEEARTLDDVEVYLIPELVREMRPLSDLKALYKIKAILRELKKDGKKGGAAGAVHPIIVHTHSSKAGILGRWAAYLSGIKLIIHSVHGFGFNNFQSPLVRSLYVFLERMTSFITRKFIAVSASNITTGVERGIFTEDRVALIRSGIDIEKF